MPVIFQTCISRKGINDCLKYKLYYNKNPSALN